LLDHHLIGLQVLTFGQVFAGQWLDDHRQMNLGIDAQRGEKVVAQIVTRHRRQLQIVGAWRVLSEVLAGEAFLLFQAAPARPGIAREKLLQRLDFDRWRIAQRRQILQRQIAADRMVRPAPGARGRCTKQQQEECQLHCF
jgi:hypothetical protein